MIAGTWDDFLRFVNRASWAWNSLLGQDDENKLTGALGTEQATTSGTAKDFTDIPPWVKKITIMFVGVSTNGTSRWLVQIGDSGGIEATGYNATGSALTNGGAVVVESSAAGFIIASGNAANVIHGTVVLSLENASLFTWVASGHLTLSSALVVLTTGGSKDLSAALDRVRITTVNGTDNFDAGRINIIYE